MSGHSKWAGIKHQKAVTDKRRGKLFTKLANNIAVAVKEGKSSDAGANPRLRDAVARGKDAGMPGEVVQRAIERGSAKNEANVEEIVYEGYGPHGVAVIVEVITDNKNRAAAEVRSVFTKYNGKLGGAGSVAWMFENRGVITIETTNSAEAILQAIDAGAKDVEEADEAIIVYTEPEKLSEVVKKIEASGLVIKNKAVEKIPKQTTPIKNEESARAVIKFMEALDDADDVVGTYANFEIPSEIAEKL